MLLSRQVFNIPINTSIIIFKYKFGSATNIELKFDESLIISYNNLLK